MAAFIRSSLMQVIPLLRTQLMNFLAFPIERVVVQKKGSGAGNDRVASMQADQFVVIRPDEENPVGDFLKAAGRHDDRVNRGVTIFCWNRLNVDYPNQDISWLTDPTYGELLLEDAVKNALTTWFPTDSKGNVLCIPSRPTSVAAPAGEYADWGLSAVAISFQFYLAVNQKVIFPGAQ